MQYSDVKIKKVNEKAIIPTYGSEEAAGADLYACLDDMVVIKKGETVFVPTGVAIELPKGRKIIEGSIYYSMDEEVNKDTKWRSTTLDITNLETNKIININLREGTTYYYASLTDEKGGIYTSIIETY